MTESGRRSSRQGRRYRTVCLGLRMWMNTFNRCFRYGSWYCGLLLRLLFKRSRISLIFGFNNLPPIWVSKDSCRSRWIARSVHSHRSRSVTYASRIQTGVEFGMGWRYVRRWRWEIPPFTSCREARSVKACWSSRSSRSSWRMHASCKWCCISWRFKPRRGAHRRRWVQISARE